MSCTEVRVRAAFVDYDGVVSLSLRSSLPLTCPSVPWIQNMRLSAEPSRMHTSSPFTVHCTLPCML